MTFSITARCEKTGMLGVAVSTARPAVGSLVPYLKSGDEHTDPVKELFRIYERCQSDLFPYTANLVKRKEGSKL